MSKKIAIVSLFIALYLLIPAIFIRKINIYSIDSSQNTISILPGNTYSTTIFPTKNKINYLELLLKNPNLSNRENFYIRTNNKDYEINSFNIGDPTWLRLETNMIIPKDSNLEIQIINPKSNKNNILLSADSGNSPSIKATTKLTLSEGLDKSLEQKIGWLQNTSRVHLVIYIILIIVICFI